MKLTKHLIYSGIYLLLSIVALVILANTHITPSKPYAALAPQQDFAQARVEKVEQKDAFQTTTVRILDGNEKGQTQTMPYDPQHVQANILRVGDTVVLAKQMGPANTAKYFITDRYRISRMVLIIAGFLFLVLLIAGSKGFGSIFGLLVSITIIYTYVLPNILAGQDPLTICFYGSLAIILITTYAAHGFSRQTTVALISTLAAIFLTYFIAKFVVSFSLLSGFGTEDAYDLHFGAQHVVDMRGLLLGGVMIATVGALNDITTTQAAAVFHLVDANKKLPFTEVFSRGFSIGREHVISLVNTLVLAYVGSSLAVFIVMFYNPLNQPYWTMMNSEVISEEVVKTVAGTFGLILSMPIVTLLASAVTNQELKHNVKILLRSIWN